LGLIQTQLGTILHRCRSQSV